MATFAYDETYHERVRRDAYQKTQEEMQPCPVCFTFVHPNNYERHMNLYHPELKAPENRLPIVVDDEFKALIPPQTAEENDALEQSIMAEGCRDPLIVWKEHNILVDGHHRYEICIRHSLPYHVRDKSFESREDVIVWMVQNQLARRNITPFARGELALRMKTAIAAKAKENQIRKPRESVPQKSVEQIDTQKAVAKVADVSHDTIHKVETVVKDAPKPIRDKARSGEISTNRAYLMTKALKGAHERVIGIVDRLNIDEPKRVQILIRLHKSSGSPTTNGTFDEIERTGGFAYGKDMKLRCNFADDPIEKIEAALAELSEQHRRMASEAKKAAREAIPDDMPEHDDRYTLIVGDFVDALKDTPDASIDVIITDPPYGTAHVGLYEQLACEAARLLKPGGSLLAMCGQYTLPETLYAMSKHIRYHWTLAYLTPGQSPQIFPRKVNTFWKPVLWFVNGEYDGAWIGDVAKSSENDKRFHMWGQSESGMADLIEKFSCAGDLILDPFLGGGTTAVVALKLNRRIIGVDLDPQHIETTKERIEQWLLTVK